MPALKTKAAIVSSLPAMAANPQDTPRPGGNIRVQVAAGLWVPAAMDALRAAWCEANDLVEWLETGKKLVEKEAYAAFVQKAGKIDEEINYSRDSRIFVVNRTVPDAKHAAAATRMHERALRDPPPPLVCNHFFSPGPGTTERTNNFRAVVPVTLLYEYKVPQGLPNAGRLMPVWIGDLGVSKPGDRCQAGELIECGVTALMNITQPGESSTLHNPLFKCLEAGVNLNELLCNSDAKDERALAQHSAKLLKAWGRGEVGRLGAGGG